LRARDSGPRFPPEPTAWVQVTCRRHLAESAELVDSSMKSCRRRTAEDGISDLAAARDELGRAQREEAAARRP